MNITKAHFRGLILAATGCAVLYLVAYIGGFFQLPPELKNFANGRSQVLSIGSAIWLTVLGLGMLVATVVSVIGLFVFWRPARPLTLFLAVVGLSLTPLSGPVVESGLTCLFHDLTMVLQGVIITLAYFSPVKDHFVSSPKRILQASPASP
jgi:hypothetical protein